MREIKFRGKTKDGRWVYGFYVNYSAFEEALGDSTEIIRHSIKRYDGGDIEDIDPKTRGQYTGLNDKNGVKIFEGDIVNTKFNNRKINGEILYLNGGFSFFGEIEVAMSSLSGKAFEVIGNIHDNPALLEVNA